MPTSTSPSSSADDSDDDLPIHWLIVVFLVGVVLVEVALVCFWLWGLAGLD